MADILSLADARLALRLPAGDTGGDADLLATYIPAVTPIVEDVIGPVVTRTATVYRDGGRSSILLPSAVTAVTTVLESSTTLVANVDYTVNLASGIVTRGSVRQPYIFLPGQQNIAITYTAGAAADSTAVPANVKLAARIICAHLVRADEVGERPNFGTDDNVVATPSGFMIPRRAQQLLMGTVTIPGFA